MIFLTMHNVKTYWASFKNEYDISIEIECNHGSHWKLNVCKFIMDYKEGTMKLFLPWEEKSIIGVPFTITVNGHKTLFKIVRI